MPDPEFRLEDFFPYLARNFNAAVSAAISQVYREKYDMAPAEWRCMAILGSDTALTARVIAKRASMDKVSVSRAIARLHARAWVEIRSDSSDGRAKLVSLTAGGRLVFEDILPQVRAVERELLKDISPQDRATLLRVMNHIMQKAKDATT